MNGPKNLILCYWVGLGQGTIESFVASLRRTGFAGDVCVCVEGVAAATVAALRAHGIIVERAAPSAQPRMAGPASRYFTWLDVLARHGDGYANVMLTDPAGTTRAADPFAAPLPADIVYTHGGGRLGGSPPTTMPSCRPTASRWRTTCATARCPLRARSSARGPASFGTSWR